MSETLSDGQKAIVSDTPLLARFDGTETTIVVPVGSPLRVSVKSCWVTSPTAHYLVAEVGHYEPFEVGTYATRDEAIARRDAIVDAYLAACPGEVTP